MYSYVCLLCLPSGRLTQKTKTKLVQKESVGFHQFPFLYARPQGSPFKAFLSFCERSRCLKWRSKVHKDPNTSILNMPVSPVPGTWSTVRTRAWFYPRTSSPSSRTCPVIPSVTPPPGTGSARTGPTSSAGRQNRYFARNISISMFRTYSAFNKNKANVSTEWC